MLTELKPRVRVGVNNKSILKQCCYLASNVLISIVDELLVKELSSEF